MKEYRYSRSYNKYPDGYYPKVQYWTKVLQGMVQSQDIEGMVWASSKIQYFVKRQRELELQQEQEADSQISIMKDSGEDWC